ncbi:DUF6519 domain-containing protein [Methylomonas sp. MED-D]|uniref:DUF6519 domain-containing protein n=1 Tax=unclassified Methylomonas TaxID=2608980 RepID=UPI0028A42F9C|nr:DUF6519 domain-containing protein [Methylomonas sp. MV1]MDT4331519.1 DUF6519 domain-containing protein [Methylomonas sp. MV1]
MKGNFSRMTFTPDKQFLRVLMQQGRVQLDADWNEQSAILLHYLQTLATDLIGPYAGPAAAFGFEINSKPKPKAGDFNIGPGRYYVDGLLCENPAQRLTYLSQPNYRLDEKAGPLQFGSYLAYLDVWERHISYLEDDDIREKALNGADTASRSQLVWQVKTLELPEGLDWREALNSRLIVSQACLAAQVKPADAPTDACCQQPDARYRGQENQLYRIEIHSPGGGESPATFKWSRENGAVAFPVTNLVSDAAVATLTVTLEHLGRDDKLTLTEKDWVELQDDDSVLLNTVSPLCQVTAIDRVNKIVTLAGTNPLVYRADRHPLLRRWDQQGDAEGLAIKPDEWLPVEAGIEVRFTINGELRGGDYWLIPARTATGDIEWPGRDDGQGNRVALSKRPAGVEHHYAPLALIEVGEGDVVAVTEDLRCGFSPLSANCKNSLGRRLGDGAGIDALCQDNRDR